MDTDDDLNIQIRTFFVIVAIISVMGIGLYKICTRTKNKSIVANTSTQQNDNETFYTNDETHVTNTEVLLWLTSAEVPSTPVMPSDHNISFLSDTSEKTEILASGNIIMNLDN